MAAHHRSYRHKLLRVMLLSFLIPAVAATGFLCYFQARREVQRVRQDQAIDVSRLSSVLGRQLDMAVQMAFHCANDTFVVSLSNRAYNVLEFYELTNKLRTLKAANSFLDDILIVYPNVPMVYTSDGAYPVEKSPTSILFNGQTAAEYTADTSLRFTFDRVQISRAGQTRDSLCYLYNDLIHPDIKVMVTLELRQLGYGDADDGALWAVISDDTRKTLLCGGMEKEGALALALTAADEKDELTVDGVRYLAARATDTDYGFTLTSLWPVSQVLPSVVTEALLILCIGVAISLLAAVMIYRIANKTYAPVKELYASVAGGGTSGSADEFGVIGSALEHLQTTVSSQGQTLQSQQPAVRMQLISRLINGVYESAEDFNYAASASGMALTHGCYLSLIATCAPEDEHESLLLALQQMTDERVDLFGCQTLSPDQSLFILSACDPMQAQRFLSDAYASLRQRLGASVTLYASTCGTDFSRIGQMTLECRTLAERCGRNGQLNVFRSDVQDARQLLQASARITPLLRRLRQSIYNGNVEDAQRCLREVNAYAQGQELSAFASQYIGYDVIGCVISALNELLNQQETGGAESIDLSAFADLRAIGDLPQATRELSALIADALNRQAAQTRHSRPSMDDVEAFIRAHYSDYDFSVKQVAEYAQLSLSAFSQSFRSQKSMTVIDYVLACRIDAAKDMLAHTDKMISEIVFAIGYVSVPSFVNKFKRVVGMTPGEYREQTRKESFHE